MKKNELRCPVCHATYTPDAAVEDDAAMQVNARMRELPTAFAGALQGYINTLFRPKQQSLRWSRHLDLIDGVLALTSDRDALKVALLTTTEWAAQKKLDRVWQPPKPGREHAALKSVLVANPQRPKPLSPIPATKPEPPPPRDKARAQAALAKMKRNIRRIPEAPSDAAREQAMEAERQRQLKALEDLNNG